MCTCITPVFILLKLSIKFSSIWLLAFENAINGAIAVTLGYLNYALWLMRLFIAIRPFPWTDSQSISWRAISVVTHNLFKQSAFLLL
jgi:hypothetical protein